MIGSATVIADFTLPGADSQVAARLLDVGPDGRETLISRGLWRPQVSRRPVRQVFQLHPGGWRFAAGHTVKLELLPSDAPYGRASDGQRPVTVSNLQLRLPTVNRPGAAGGLVRTPLAKFLPPGYALAREFAQDQ
jgi:predicted acyl esterase